MNGQWFGDYKLAGQRKGRITLNLERLKDHYCGCLITDGPTYEPSAVYNVTLSKRSGNEVSGSATFVSYVDRISNSLLDMSLSELRSHFPHVENTISLDVSWAGRHVPRRLRRIPRCDRARPERSKPGKRKERK